MTDDDARFALRAMVALVVLHGIVPIEEQTLEGYSRVVGRATLIADLFLDRIEREGQVSESEKPEKPGDTNAAK